jgi:outer membrane protein TolC
MTTVLLFGQTPELSHGKGFVRDLISPYRPHQVVNVNFDDSPRLERLMRAGQIYLSLRDAIALALENNLDIEYARFNPKLSESNLLRANAGQLLRNVSNSINTGPSSASLGVLAGANSLGTTGAASSSGGQGGVLSGLNVQLAGSSIPNLDPVLFGLWQFSHTTNPQSSTFVTGTNFLVTQYQAAQTGVQKGFLTGTTVTFGLVNTIGLHQNSPTNDFNPLTTGSLSLQITQNLLQGFGIAVNNRAIRVAKNQLQMSDLTFKQQVIATVANVVNLYWDLVTFNDNLHARREALELNETLYTDNRRREELGAIAGIDLIQSQAELKGAQQDVINAETQVRQQETILKSVLTRGGVDNLAIATARIIPTDHIAVPAAEPVVPIQDLIVEALANRPEIAQSKMGLENSRINMLGTKSALRPQLQAFLNLANNGQAGDVNTIPVPVTTVNGQTAYVVRTPGNVNGFFLGGYGSVLSQLFSRNFPNYTVGLQLNMPLRNRAAQADMITDELNYRQQQIQDRQLVNNIKVNVVNNWVTVSQARAAYETSVVARQLQEQTLAGEKRKYELGTSTFLNVLIVQRDTTNRKLAEVDARSQYVRARTNLEQATGRILKDYDVDMQDAISGTVRREPDPLPVLEQHR